MKLKNIVALALTGIITVSALTGCVNGGTVPDDEKGSGIVTGYSSVLGKYMEKTSKKDYFTFQDDPAAAAALEDALGNRGTLLLSANTVAPMPLPVISGAVCNDFKNNLGLDVVVTDVINGVFGDWAEVLRLFDCEDTASQVPQTMMATLPTKLSPDFTDAVNTTKKVGMIFVVDGTISVEKALKQIADGAQSYINEIELQDWYTNTNWKEDGFSYPGDVVANNVRELISLDSITERLPESKTSGDSNSNGTTWEYTYNISASVVNKALTVFDGYNGSANFIAVTITRTVK